MDTSNSRSSINNHWYVDNGHKVKASELTFEDWRSIVHTAFHHFIGIEKYLPFVLPTNGVLIHEEEWSARYYARAYHPPVQISSKSTPGLPRLTSETRLLPITHYCFWQTNGVNYNLMVGWNRGKFEDHFLLRLVDYSNSWVRLTRCFRRKEDRAIRAFSKITLDRYVYTPIEWQDLEEVIQSEPAFGVRIISSIARLAKVGIQRKESHIETLRDRMNRVGAMLERLE
ncbi:MAG: hypothetical protein HYV68_00575 [Candidatus Taylorbacteria bacterium]|nr:hypothetical protein [Candidatus Taylorbacteria bacterium]